MSKNIRTFNRLNPDGSVETVTVTWDSANPMATFELDAAGFKGNSCVETLRGLEEIIGASTMTLKSEAFDSDGERPVFVVGYDN